jgi:hypothetical protein
MVRKLTRRFLLGGAASCAAIAALPGCVPPSAAAAQIGPLPANAARIWFYRDYEPSVSLNYANVALNGVPAASVPPDGGAIYRDVAPGHYHISVESFGRDVNQAKDVDLGPGQEAFVKILASDTWVGSGDFSSFKRDTFYVSLVPPQVARAELGARALRG